MLLFTSTVYMQCKIL